MATKARRADVATYRSDRGEMLTEEDMEIIFGDDITGLESEERDAPGVTGSEAPVPGWSKKISRPSDVIASTHP
jgi:hypothetical protein